MTLNENFRNAYGMVVNAGKEIEALRALISDKILQLKTEWIRQIAPYNYNFYNDENAYIIFRYNIWHPITRKHQKKGFSGYIYYSFSLYSPDENCVENDLPYITIGYNVEEPDYNENTNKTGILPEGSHGYCRDRLFVYSEGETILPKIDEDSCWKFSVPLLDIKSIDDIDVEIINPIINIINNAGEDKIFAENSKALTYKVTDRKYEWVPNNQI